MRYPAKLKEKATVGLVAPSSPVSAQRERECIEAMERLGYQVKAAGNLSSSKGGYMAGDERIRGEWINRMFADPEVDAVFCIRGGDGANRIIPFLDLDIIRNHPKIFVGYSDVTSLHLLFNQQCDLVTFHGPMVASNIVDHFDPESRAAFFEALTGAGAYRYRAPAGKEIGICRQGRARGMLTGGNLTVLCASIGTPYEIDTDGKILFIEEIGEHIGNLDRHIYQLRNAGKLDRAAGILLGQFTDCRQDEPDYSIVNVVQEAAGDRDIPIMYNIQSGHDFPMINLPMGAMCTMDCEEKFICFDKTKQETGR